MTRLKLSGSVFKLSLAPRRQKKTYFESIQIPWTHSLGTLSALKVNSGSVKDYETIYSQLNCIISVACLQTSTLQNSGHKEVPLGYCFYFEVPLYEMSRSLVLYPF